jgi:1-aminocyclopropane-1-carboxylate deaminase/D-cysteine desulfhydrase-like pyridoxal-dependent ACC family enzyme
MGPEAESALLTAARTEGLLLDPVYTAKAMAGFIARAREASPDSTLLFLHTGGQPALFAYQSDLEALR